MKLIAASLSGLIFSSAAQAFSYCVVQPNHTCITDTGRVFHESRGTYIDPATGEVVMRYELRGRPATMRHQGNPNLAGAGINPPRYYVVPPDASRGDPHPADLPPGAIGGPLAPIINGVTGEVLAPAGAGHYVGTRDGRLYAPAGPSGIIDTRTGGFIPVQ